MKRLKWSLNKLAPFHLRVPLMDLKSYRWLMSLYWRRRKSWPGCCAGFKGAGKTWQNSTQCDDCPMHAWDATAQARFVGSIKDGHWIIGDKTFGTYDELKAK